MDPLHEREVLYVAHVAGRQNSHRYEAWTPVLWSGGAIHTLAELWASTAVNSRLKERDIVHKPALRTVMPSRKPYVRDGLIGVSNALAGIPVFRRQPEMIHAKPTLQTLLSNLPVWWTILPRKRPHIETRHHQRLVSRKVGYGPYAKRTDELSASHRLSCGHGFSYLTPQIADKNSASGRCR